MAADGFITDLKRKFQQGDIVLRLVYVNVAVFLAVTLVHALCAHTCGAAGQQVCRIVGKEKTYAFQMFVQCV